MLPRVFPHFRAILFVGVIITHSDTYVEVLHLNPLITRRLRRRKGKKGFLGITSLPDWVPQTPAKDCVLCTPASVDAPLRGRRGRGLQNALGCSGRRCWARNTVYVVAIGRNVDHTLDT